MKVQKTGEYRSHRQQRGTWHDAVRRQDEHGQPGPGGHYAHGEASPGHGNVIDTEDVYSLGESETLMGNALKGVRDEIVLATKVRLPMSENFNRSGATRVNIMHEVEGGLRRLQTDYIGLYQVHGWDSNTPLEETLRTLDDLVRHGKVRYIGLSNFMSWQAATAVMVQERLGLQKYVTAQMYYSLVGRGLEYEFQSFAEYHNIGILVWSPLAGGFLTGKYSRAPTLLLPPPDSRRQVRSCPSIRR